MLELLNRCKYYVCDTETTGLRKPAPPASGVVQLAITQICPQTLEKLDEFDALVNPGCPIEPGAQAVHGISWNMVKDCDPLQDLFTVPGPSVFIAHNVPFDLPRLAGNFENIVASFCTLQEARSVFGSSVPNHKLQTLADVFKLEKGEAHKADGDVVTTVNFLRHLVATTGLSLVELVFRQQKPVTSTTMPFGKYKGISFMEVPLPYIQYMLSLDIDINLRKTLENQLKLRG